MRSGEWKDLMLPCALLCMFLQACCKSQIFTKYANHWEGLVQVHKHVGRVAANNQARQFSQPTTPCAWGWSSDSSNQSLMDFFFHRIR
ncbi:hypothetical protein BX070DRAFT_9969 [Coemansia spiralis]|nr:hypothetical protein BX070DRAFT_9969 [Coemansia spiralis]